jgi:hypothetical protein
MNDKAYRPKVEEIVMETDNPRLKLAGVEAIGIYGYPESLPMLIDALRVPNPPPYLRDEVTLAMASILDVQSRFYSLLVRFLSDESQAAALATDEAESATEYYISVHGRKRNKKDPLLAGISHQAKAFQPAVSDFVHHLNGNRLCRWILELPDDIVHETVRTVLSEVVLDDELVSHRRLRLLITHWASHELRLWTNNLKK